jgi:hypothetical protein
VRPGSRTKVSVPSVLPQNRHPERSASQAYRLTEDLRRGVESPRGCLINARSAGLSGHQNYEKIEKITTSDRSVAQWRDLQFRFRAGRKCRERIASWFRFSVNANCRSLRCATPDLLSNLVALASFTRLSLLKAPHVAAGKCRVAGNPGTLRSV